MAINQLFEKLENYPRPLVWMKAYMQFLSWVLLLADLVAVVVFCFSGDFLILFLPIGALICRLLACLMLRDPSKSAYVINVIAMALECCIWGAFLWALTVINSRTGLDMFPQVFFYIGGFAVAFLLPNFIYFYKRRDIFFLDDWKKENFGVKDWEDPDRGKFLYEEDQGLSEEEVELPELWEGSILDASLYEEKRQDTQVLHKKEESKGAKKKFCIYCGAPLGEDGVCTVCNKETV
jgi:hypothetical protein